MNAIDTTTRQFQDLADKFEITELVSRLGRALDEGDWEELAELYTLDASARTPGGLATGREALVTQARRNHSPDRHIQHVISGVLITLDGDTARVRANLLAVFAWDPAQDPTLGSRPQLTLGEIYRFEAVRTPGGWRFSRVESSPVWSVGTRPAPATP
ncbi:nuclear transport factor 2 family protein [Nocardia sp. CDC160]|uniref:nuclear transport factor 2 family protein n=1 Tax=Nocardia sp. CDC160 TaxID=3112166 RepID=UPI002DB8296D|nr:nuclear transport factor 2 family protein [Nocardia sp. CDC160]MEC3919923.1 nuclear transport factor 2 family protein [Nocardia sp. CDC160]